MNRLQSLTADREFCVTLNRTGEIDPAKVIDVSRFMDAGGHLRWLNTREEAA